MRTFNTINERSSKPLILRKTKTKVITYGSNESSLKIKGVVNLLIESKNKYITTKFYIIETDHKNLLSGSAALDLNVIRLNSNESLSENTCAIQIDPNETPEALLVKNNDPIEQFCNNNQNNENDVKPYLHEVPKRLHDVLIKYENTIFSGKIGKMKDHKITLHVDKSVTPVTQKERRIPFALRKKVNDQIDKLEKAGIIEDVTNEPTTWLNPLVVVPKGDNSIRIRLDMRCANKAITRTRYPTPTVDDLLVKLEGSKVFTKLDLNSAFHQLELDEESCHLTAFQSDTKIKRFKRLIFGANSAAEELQQALRLVLCDIDGSLNIADDILLFADSELKHDEILQRVLKRLSDKGITLNLKKCL